MMNRTKFCQNCGNMIDVNAVICPYCGVQVANIGMGNIVINNTANATANANASTNNVNNPKAKNKWIALLLCFFGGVFGLHKFYEEKTGMGILYICTIGLFGIGAIIDFVQLLFKPNPYYV